MSLEAVLWLHNFLNDRQDAAVLHNDSSTSCNDSTTEEQVFSVSIGVVLTVFMFSEILIMGLCKIAAWYAHVSFYSQFSSSSYMDYWDREDDRDISSRDRYQTIYQSLQTRTYCRDQAERIIQLDMCFSLDPTSDDTCCPICLVEFEEQDTVSSGRNCHHLFHKHCITQWLQKQSSCPCCRSDMFTERRVVMEKLPSSENNNETNSEQQQQAEEISGGSLVPVWSALSGIFDSRDSFDLAEF